jgi:hypothetical protein
MRVKMVHTKAVITCYLKNQIRERLESGRRGTTPGKVLMISLRSRLLLNECRDECPKDRSTIPFTYPL